MFIENRCDVCVHKMTMTFKTGVQTFCSKTRKETNAHVEKCSDYVVDPKIMKDDIEALISKLNDEVPEENWKLENWSGIEEFRDEMKFLQRRYCLGRFHQENTP